MGSATMVTALGSDYDAARATGLKALVARIDGVDFVDFNYTTNKLTVKFDSDRLSLRELESVVMREKQHHARSVMRFQSGSEADGD